MSELTTIKFYGSSDDNFCWDSPKDWDETGCFDRIPVVRVLDSEGDSCLVVGHYAPNGYAGTWSIGVAPFDEDVPLPDWDFQLGAEGYTATLTITGPGLEVQQWNDDTQLWEAQ